MASRIIPLVLNNRTLADGEKAFLLSVSGNGGSTVSFYEQPASFRSSKMKGVFILQVSLPEDEGPYNFDFNIRSPFPGDEGEPSHSPSINMQFLNANYDYATLSNTWEADGEISPAPNFFLFENTIPAYFFTLTLEPEGEGNTNFTCQITVDFSHSIT